MLGRNPNVLLTEVRAGRPPDGVGQLAQWECYWRCTKARNADDGEMPRKTTWDTKLAMLEADGDAPETLLAEMRRMVDKERDEKGAANAKVPHLAVRDATAKFDRLQQRETMLLELVAGKEKELEQTRADLAKLQVNLAAAKAELAAAQRKHADASAAKLAATEGLEAVVQALVGIPTMFQGAAQGVQSRG